jgi:hypothetical protein
VPPSGPSGMDAGARDGGGGGSGSGGSGGAPSGGSGGEPSGGSGGEPSGGSGGVPSGGSGGSPPVGECGSVHLVVDGSGSMDEGFDTGTRWQAVRDALVGSGGVIEALQARVGFGFTIYRSNTGLLCIPGFPLPGFSCDAGTGAACPDLLADLPPMLDAYAAIDAAYPTATPGGQTPTAETLEALYPGIDAATAVVLITDGAPNGCDGSTDPTPVFTAAAAAAGNGIRTHVVGVAPGDAQLQGVLDQIAAAGGTTAAAAPATVDELRAALMTIVESGCP